MSTPPGMCREAQQGSKSLRVCIHWLRQQAALQAADSHVQQNQLNLRLKRTRQTGGDESWDCPGGDWRGGLVGAEGRAEMLVEKRLTVWQIYSSGGGGSNPSPSSHWL